MRKSRHLTEWQSRRNVAHAVFFVLLACLTVFAFRVKTSNCLPVKDAPPWCSLAAKMMVDRDAPLQSAGPIADLDLALLPLLESESIASPVTLFVAPQPAGKNIQNSCTSGLRAPPSLL